MSSKLILGFVGVGAFTIIGLGIAIYVQTERIKAIKSELQLVNEHADDLEKSCMYLEELNRKTNESLSKLINDNQNANARAVDRLETISNADDAKNWGADPLPESIRLLFCDVNTNISE